jgi:HSP20 family protein
MKNLTLTPKQLLRPWSLYNGFEEEMNNLLGNITSDTTFSPAIDLVETDGAFEINADVPGISKDEINIEVADNVITIKGERKKEKEINEKNAHRIERTYGAFRRAFQIPGGFDHSNVQAEFGDGVLKVTLPKPKEKQPRRIEVKG